MRRRTTRVLINELREVKYLKKLSEEDKAYYLQFMYEYYQADFNFEQPIHPPELVKDCRDRKNASYRRLEAVGGDKVIESLEKIRAAQHDTSRNWRYYLPEDYLDKQDYQEIDDE